MPFARPAHLRAFALIALLAVFAGCGKKEKSEIAVAEVDDVVISLEYFETKMNTIPTGELPADIALQSGREELLETMIKKEVMVMKAVELGMDEDGEVNSQAQKIADLTAVTKLRNEVASASEEVTEDEIRAYYEMLPRRLMVSYMVFDYEQDAIEARGLVAGGERWTSIAEQYQAGDPGRNDNFTMQISYGTVADDFEREVFSLPVGAISEPIETPYGFFVVRVDDVTMERVQPLDQIREQVVASVRKQKEALALADFLEEVFEEYDLYINEEALKAVYEGIPEDIPLQPPYPETEELPPLAVDSEWLDQVLFSFSDQVWTVARYADFFNNSSIFGRPRQEGRPGGLRRKVKENVVRELMATVAIDRGYGDLPEVEAEFRSRREMLMVSRLNEQLVQDQVDVSAAEVEAWFEENKEQFRQPEVRDVLAIICETEADCLSAEIDLAGGATWAEVVETYCVESDVRQQQGKVGKMASTVESPIKDIVFAIEEEGQMSAPTELPDGRWAMVKVVLIEPEQVPDLAEVRAQAGARLAGIREDALFDSLIEEWMSEHTIKRYPERLMDAVYAPNPKQNVIQVGG